MYKTGTGSRKGEIGRRERKEVAENSTGEKKE